MHHKHRRITAPNATKHRCSTQYNRCKKTGVAKCYRSLFFLLFTVTFLGRPGCNLLFDLSLMISHFYFRIISRQFWIWSAPEKRARTSDAAAAASWASYMMDTRDAQARFFATVHYFFFSLSVCTCVYCLWVSLIVDQGGCVMRVQCGGVFWSPSRGEIQFFLSFFLVVLLSSCKNSGVYWTERSYR